MKVEELLRLARAATPGPWTFEPFQPSTPTWGAMAASAGPAIVTGPASQADADAAYIAAANPSTVTALCKRVLALEAAAQELYDASPYGNLGPRHRRAMDQVRALLPAAPVATSEAEL